MENKENEKNLLSVNFLIRMTEQEKEILERKASKLKISQAEYLRKSLADSEEIYIDNSNQNKSVLSKSEYNLLLNIANNLNQNTKFANTNKFISEDLVTSINSVMEFIESKS
jgi:hypothetical protein